ncbi:hypothetical protein H9S87_18965 (plasmid) [Bacillus pumilus]|uniref:hypothetical protein n=1 Tax=Bacillus pumilus TaxID=1408 RepID=UPI00165795D5|nr:hypothetical protein [Bacillus pumilus]QNP18256.1 hypothetical protein H9S87_18965 [Bacillus pumilus]
MDELISAVKNALIVAGILLLSLGIYWLIIHLIFTGHFYWGLGILIFTFLILGFWSMVNTFGFLDAILALIEIVGVIVFSCLIVFGSVDLFFSGHAVWSYVVAGVGGFIILVYIFWTNSRSRIFE